MVLAGGIGSRLHPLTAERSKPAVPFSGRYRIVDFVLSNLVNSDIHAIYMLVQYKSQSLIEHASHAWSLSHVIPGQFIAIVPPQMREGQEWFQGTADAIHQNINLIETHAPDMVAVFGADHILWACRPGTNRQQADAIHSLTCSARANSLSAAL